MRSLLGYDYRASRAMKDRRRAHRGKAESQGWVRPDGGFAARPCEIIDLSHAGVRIRADGLQIGDVFTLVLSRRGSVGRRVRVKWRRGVEIGGEFI